MLAGCTDSIDDLYVEVSCKLVHLAFEEDQTSNPTCLLPGSFLHKWVYSVERLLFSLEYTVGFVMYTEYILGGQGIVSGLIQMEAVVVYRLLPSPFKGEVCPFASD